MCGYVGYFVGGEFYEFEICYYGVEICVEENVVWFDVVV